MEQSFQVFEVLDEHTLDRVLYQLQIKFPDHCPDDPYPLDNIHSAVTWTLSGGGTFSQASPQWLTHTLKHNYQSTISNVLNNDQSAISDVLLNNHVPPATHLAMTRMLSAT